MACLHAESMANNGSRRAPYLLMDDQTRPRTRTRNLVGAGLALVIMLVLVLRLAGGWHQIEPQLSNFRIGPIIAAVGLFVFGEAVIAVTWLLNLESLGTVPRRMRGIATVFVSNLGRLVPIPGAPLLARVGLADHAGAPRDAASATVLMEGLLGTLAAFSLGMAALLDNTTASVVPGGRWWFLVWMAFALLVVLGLANRMFDGVLKRLGKGPLPRMTAPRALGAFVLYLIAWLAFGLALSAILTALALDSPGWLTTAGMFALSWFVGFVVVIVPGGLGIREGSLAAMLAPAVGTEAAILVTLVSRLLWWLTLVLLAATGASVLGRSILRPRREQLPADQSIQVPIDNGNSFESGE